MRRVLIVLAAVLSTGACSSGGDDASSSATTGAPTATTRPVSQRQAEANAVTDQLVAGRYDEVVSSFNAEMLMAMSAASLKTAWEQVINQYGAYKSRGATALATAEVTGAVAFDTPMTFERAALKCRVAIDNDGKVALLRILPAGAA